MATQKEFEQQRRIFEQDPDGGSPTSSQWSSGWPVTPGASTTNHPQQIAEVEHTHDSPQRTPMSPVILNLQLPAADLYNESTTSVAFGGSNLAIPEETDAVDADQKGYNHQDSLHSFDKEKSPASMYGMEEPCPQDYDGSYFAPKRFSAETTGLTTDRSNRSPSDSVSDGPATPRAGTPSDQATSMKLSFSKQQWGSHLRNDTIDDEVNGGFIHPEHLTSPGYPDPHAAAVPSSPIA